MIEKDMVDVCYDYLSTLSNVKLIKKEVPFLSRCIDIVIVTTSDEIISIEFKVSKWRHAIEQATNHKLGADKAYICLPKRRITPTLFEAINEAGLGLLMYDANSDKKIVEAIPLEHPKENIAIFRTLLSDNISKV